MPRPDAYEAESLADARRLPTGSFEPTDTDDARSVLSSSVLSSTPVLFRASRPAPKYRETESYFVGAVGLEPTTSTV